MRITFIILLQLLVHLPLYSQSFLANGSFEDENICTEFNQKCSPAGWITTSIGLPLYYNSYALDGKAFDRIHFIKLIAGNNKIEGARTFVTTRLLCSLRKGNKYLLEFYYRSSFNSLDSIGILFSNKNFLYEKNSFKKIEPTSWIKCIDPEIKKNENTDIPWIKCAYIYTADGNELFFTIGVFKRNDFEFTSSINKEQELNLYLDKISFNPVNINERICLGADSIKRLLYRQNDRHSRLEKRRAAFINNPPIIYKPETTILRYIDTLVLPDIFFKSASANLENKNYQILDSFVNIIKNKPLDSIVCIGHTDSIGSYAYNKKLSAERAQTVAQYFAKKIDISIDKIIIYNHAFLKPMDSNITVTGRQKNRRVEMYFYGHE